MISNNPWDLKGTFTHREAAWWLAGLPPTEYSPARVEPAGWDGEVCPTYKCDWTILEKGHVPTFNELTIVPGSWRPGRPEHVEGGESARIWLEVMREAIRSGVLRPTGKLQYWDEYQACTYSAKPNAVPANIAFGFNVTRQALDEWRANPRAQVLDTQLAPANDAATEWNSLGSKTKNIHTRTVAALLYEYFPDGLPAGHSIYSLARETSEKMFERGFEKPLTVSYLRSGSLLERAREIYEECRKAKKKREQDKRNERAAKKPY